MKKWVIIALIVQAILIMALAAVMYFVPIQLEWTSHPSSVPPTTIAQSAEDGTGDLEVMTDEDWQEFERRWVSAPDEIRDIARQIAEGGTPSSTLLQEIGPDALSRGYPSPELDFSRNGTPVAWQTTLLQEAVWAYNLEATTALLSAGADPNANHGEVLFNAIEQKTRGAPNFMLFPDHSEMVPFLRLLLESGANPNVQRHGFVDETPLRFSHSNLSAILLLLEFGADPWARHNGPNGRLSVSMINELAFGASSDRAAEILFRMARSGNLPRGEAAQELEIIRLLGNVVQRLSGSSGPDARHRAWFLDQLFVVLGNALNRQNEFQELRTGLPSFDYQTDGGWHLSEDQIHSPPRTSVAVPDRGTEIWGP